MSMLARITKDNHGDVPIVTIEGEIDASNAGEVAEHLRAPLTNRSTALIVDLGPTTYIDSAGINVLFEIGAELRERQQELHVVVAQPSPIARMLTIVGLDRAHPTYATREQAIAQVA